MRVSVLAVLSVSPLARWITSTSSTIKPIFKIDVSLALPVTTSAQRMHITIKRGLGNIRELRNEDL